MFSNGVQDPQKNNFQPPIKYKSIDKRELDYITATLPSSTEKASSVPWANIFLSIPFWSILIVHLCYNWTFYAIFGLGKY